MSGDQIVEPTPKDGEGDVASIQLSSKPSHKSYRRKYRKMMVKFEDTMRQSTSLFKEEQKIMDISQRLAEQNDQILELLSELNGYPQIPPALRYDLDGPHSTAEPTSTPARTFDALGAQETLKKARQRLRDGEMVISEYRQLEDAILDSPAFVPQQSYTSLLKLPHTPATTSHTIAGARHTLQQDSLSKPSNGYLSIQQEDQCLESLDSFLEGKSSVVRSHAGQNSGTRGSEKPAEREREMQLQNPVSVYNWLRKHQPQVFLQDNEQPVIDKRAAGGRNSKRGAVPNVAPVKPENDLYDDDGIAVEGGQGGRGKRKRDDDPGYRPKGGNSRPYKRKKDDLPPPAAIKKSKRLSTSEV